MPSCETLSPGPVKSEQGSHFCRALSPCSTGPPVQNALQSGSVLLSFQGTWAGPEALNLPPFQFSFVGSDSPLEAGLFPALSNPQSKVPAILFLPSWNYCYCSNNNNVCVCRGGVLPHWTEYVSRAEACGLAHTCGPSRSSPCSGQVLSSVYSANRALGVGVQVGGRRPREEPGE